MEVCGKLNMLCENLYKGEAENNNVGVVQTNRGSDLGFTRVGPTPANVCGCPERRQTPDLPAMDSLEVPMSEVNREKVENTIKEYYKHSGFNVCPNHELQVMTGDPLQASATPLE